MMSPVPSMPKPVTGLPVFLIPSTTRLVQPSSMPMTTQAATLGLAPVPIRVRKKVEVLAELQPSVGMRDRKRALDVVGDRLAGRVRQIIERQDEDVIAHADAAVLTPPAGEPHVRPAGLAVSVRLRGLGHAHHRLVLRLWTWTCSPFLMSATALPMSWPYFHTVSPVLMSVSAILWPIGTSIFAVRRNEELSAVITHVMVVPALRPSTTTTPTVSFFSCTSSCGAAIHSLPTRSRRRLGRRLGRSLARRSSIADFLLPNFFEEHTTTEN